MYLLRKVVEPGRGLFIHIHPRECAHVQCVLLGCWGWTRVHLREEPQLFVRDQDGGHSAQPPGCYVQHGLLGINSPALPTGGNQQVTCQARQRLHCILIHEIHPKCQIADSPPATERLHGDVWCYLPVYGGNCDLWKTGETSTVWAAVI